MPNWRCPNCGGQVGYWYTGEVTPIKCITNTLYKNKHTRTLSLNQEWVPIWEEQKLTTNHTGAASAAAVEPIKENDEEEYKEVDMGEGSSTEDLLPKQAPALWTTMPSVPKSWAVGPSDQVARRGQPASLSPRKSGCSTGGVNATSQDRRRTGVPALGRKTGGRGGLPGERCN